MTEITIHGRGGQGGVTLAKLLASAYFERGKHVQAFGIYAAERSGAPVQAYVRIDDAEITNHNLVHTPDHVIVLDRTLIGPRVLAGLRPGGWILLNHTAAPHELAEQFAGYKVATVDATGIAAEHGLGTRAVPIVNTTMLGAVAKVLGLNLEDIAAALRSTGFEGANRLAAEAAFAQVHSAELPGTAVVVPPATAAGPRAAAASFLGAEMGGMPEIHTGDWATRQPQRRAWTPPCNQGCPAGHDVRGFVAAAGKKDYDAALAILLERSPFPGICGRVCPAPCMAVCNRGTFDGAVNVREIERYIADHAAWPTPPKPHRQERVAVVGSGPAGLSAAYHLARLGYHVTLLEAGKELGGVLRTGIPSYRLPRNVLDREISWILRHGIEVHTRTPVHRKLLVEMSQRYDALFVATGLQEARGLNLGQLSSDVVTQGIDYLDHARNGHEFVTGLRVVVIGGGNTAMDAARTALRCGARRVQVLYRRTRAEMPAIHEEIEEALEEGVELCELVAPLRLRETPTGALLTCQRMELGAPDASGRRSPVPLESEDAVYDVRCDRVILALGQSADLSIFPEGCNVRSDGQLTGLTGCPIFAGGDLATNEGTVTAAIGNGCAAAWHIHKTLTGEDLFPPAAPPVAGPDVLTMHLFDPAEPRHAPLLAPQQRRAGFAEVRRGLIDGPGDPAAAAEAARCLSCGVCNDCDHCRSTCPEGIMRYVAAGEYAFDYDYCKGCGICAAQCPRGVVYMAEL
ncbi:MAG: 2-oxoacid:acceptor oxidoreductase family protein [Phycisphaerales bacterium]|nr:2-oxoacid:acceptor oxidoreductase family protein [Phycisphaerales bacterium]